MKGDSLSQLDQDIVKPPVPVFRKRHQAAALTNSRYVNEADEQTGASLSELAAAMNKVHRRSLSSSATVTQSPPTMSTTTPRGEKSEPAEKIATEKPAEKPTAKITAAQKSELAAKLSEKAELSAEKRPTKVEKLGGKLSINAKADEQTADVNVVEIKPSFRAAAKPKPPVKTGLVTEKAESAIRSNSSPVIAKRGLSEPGSTTTSKQHVETCGKSIEEKGNKFPALEIPKVKLRSTSPTSITCGPGSCQSGKSDGGLNVVGVDSERDDVASGQCVRSAERMSSEPLKTALKLESKNEAQLQMTLKSVTESENDSSSESARSHVNKSINAGRNIVSDEMPAAESKQSEPVRRPRRSEQSGVVDVQATSESALQVSKALWRPTLSTNTADEMTRSGRDCSTSVKPQRTSTVSVSKRATVFSSSDGRQFVGKSAGHAAKASDSSQSTDDNSVMSSGFTKTVASRAASFGACMSDSRMKATVTAAAEAGDRRNNKSLSSDSGARGARSAEVAVKVAAVGRWPPQAKSEEQPAANTSAAQCVDKSKVADKLSVKAEVSAEKQVERLEEKSSMVTGSSQQTAGKPPVACWVKPSGTGSLKSQRRGGLDEPTSGTAEPDKTASNSSGLSHKPSSIRSWVKPSGTSSSKNQSTDSPRDTVESGKVSGRSPSVLSEKPSSGSGSGTAAGAGKMKTSVVGVDTTSCVPKMMSSSATTSLSAVEFAATKRDLASGQSVTSTEPPWLAVARTKTRVWTEGKI